VHVESAGRETSVQTSYEFCYYPSIDGVTEHLSGDQPAAALSSPSQCGVSFDRRTANLQLPSLFNTIRFVE
jgi:hypothetical protein